MNVDRAQLEALSNARFRANADATQRALRQQFSPRPIRCKRLCPDAKLPTRAHANDAGLDLYSRKYEERRLTMKIGTGVAVEIPTGYVGLVLPRSSMNAGGTTTHVGVIDSGYCGEIFVVLYGYPVNIHKGTRIAQLVIVPCLLGDVVEEDFDGGERGAAGFGSTGR